jgi:acyl carrier protein
MTDQDNSTDQAEAVERGPAPTAWPELPEEGMLEKILKIVIDEGKVDPEAVWAEATLESLGLISIDVISILMGIEEEFDVYLPMSEELSTARNLAELIEVMVAQMRPDELKTVS